MLSISLGFLTDWGQCSVEWRHSKNLQIVFKVGFGERAAGCLLPEGDGVRS